MIWLSHKLYPQAAKGDLHGRIADFYQLFYGPPDAAAVSALLGD
ncbi:hypothetical protein [Paracoccus mutanolyticus]|nr:hypothetical protein [Paracoccus mutanolyticus]